MTPKTGRYAPRTGDKSRLDLRIERLSTPDPSGGRWIVSGDLRTDGKLHSFLSVPKKKTQPAVRHIDDATTTALDADVRFGPRNFRTGRRGSVRIDFGSNKDGTARIQCPAQSHQLDETIDVRWKDKYFRDLTIELDKITAAVFPGSATQGGTSWNLGKVFRKTGFRTRIVKSHRKLTDDPDGWSAGELHQAMEQNRRQSGDEWSSYVFLTSLVVDDAGDIEEGTVGWMFDAEIDDLNRIPREGCAVFDEAIRMYVRDQFGKLYSNRYQRELILTIAHELGHAMNLTHSFDKGRSDSPSVMNYPHEYDEGIAEYYKDQTYSFDRLELTHLRHHSPVVTQPGREGGVDFGLDEFRIATEGSRQKTGANAARLARRTKLGRELELTLRLSSRSIMLHEPLGVSVDLRKRTGKGRNASILVEAQLSWETGRLKFGLRKRGERRWSILHAPIRECRRPQFTRVGRGRGCEVEVDLLMSRTGEIFRHDGDYELCALLALWYRGVPAFLMSRPVPVRVRAPRTSEDRQLCRLYCTRGLKRLLLIPGTSVSEAARAAADELHLRARDTFAGQLATLALMREAQSYERGRADTACARFHDKAYVERSRSMMTAPTQHARFLAGKLRGVDRVLFQYSIEGHAASR